MIDDDFLRRFADDLRVGRGRAIQQARAAMDKALYQPLVLAACAHHQAYDPQCEGTRTTYLLDALDAVGARDQLRAIVLAGLPVAERWDVGHFLQLAAVLACEGDDEARAAIVAHVQTASPSADAGAALVEIDGRAGLVDPDRGLLLVARLIGERLEPGDEWITMSVYDAAVELFGSEGTERALVLGESLSPGIARFREQMRAHVAAWASADHAPSPPPTTFAELRRSIEDGPPHPRNRRGWSQASVWARQASDSELLVAASALRTEADPRWQGTLLRIFTSRAFPGSIDRLVELSRSEDELVEEQAIGALARLTGPAIYDYAWTRLGEADPPWCVLRLFGRNGRAGDGVRVAARLARVQGDDDLRHHVVGCVVDSVPEALGPAEWRAPLLWAYEASPCSMCREQVVEQLLAADVLPDELREECLGDAREDTRALVAKPAGA